MNGLIFAVWLLLASSPLLYAQTSNRLWFAIYNGQPTPSSDVAVRSVVTGGSAEALASGEAGSFVSQTNFPSFHSPFDVVVDPAMEKAYVLDNNVQGTTPEYIYSFNLTGTPAQIAASSQIIYTMPVPQADVTANLYPLLSGIALDPVNHQLYFNQLDLTTSTNSYIGRLDLASSSKSDIHSVAGGNPTLHTYYIGQVPGQGAVALDDTNLYIAAINGRFGNSGIYAAPRDGSGSFTEIVALSSGDTSFTNGFTGGLACDSQDQLIYYVTFNGGIVNGNYDLSQNALWVYDMVNHANRKISSGYPGFPDSVAVDTVNSRYYFALGRDGTGSFNVTNSQAIYTGILGTTNAPTLLYLPSLSGQDTDGQLNAGNVVLQGVFVESAPVLSPSVSTTGFVAGGASMVLNPIMTVTDPSSTTLDGASVVIRNGTFAGDGDTLVADTNGTGIFASYDEQTETLTFSGNDTLGNYQKVLRSVAFGSSNSDPTQGGVYDTRTMEWTVNADGLGSVPVKTSLAIVPSAPVSNRLALVTVGSGRILLFTGVAAQNYVIQMAAALQGPWSDLSPVLTANGDGLVAFQDTEVPLPATRFYRVRTAQ